MPFQAKRSLLAVVVLGIALSSHFARGTNPDCSETPTFADNRVPLREIFVVPNGNDTSGDGSMARPYRTLGRAASGVRPGDAIRLLPGTYPGGTLLQNLAGTSNAPIWIGGLAGSARPVFSGGSQAFQIVRARFLIVENLEVERMNQNGINCDDGGSYQDPNATRNLVFRHLAFRDIGTGGNQDALKLSGVNDYAVLDCDFLRGSAGGSGIDHVGCHQGVIARCDFTDMGSNAIQCKGGSEDIEIRQCRFTNGGQRAINIGGSTGFEFFRPPLSTAQPNVEARNIRVFANLFVGAEAPVAFVGAVECVVAHNTLIEPGRWVMRILQETTTSGSSVFLPCSSNRFINNLVWFNRSRLSTFVNSGPNTLPASFQFANNLWYAFDRPSQSQPSLPSTESGRVTGLDPRFVNVATGDYSIATNSPAAGRGLDELSHASDLAGACFASPPSIGAFEANPPRQQRADRDGDGMSDDWEQQHGFNATDPADAIEDPDGDQLDNRGEHLAGTHPKDASSVFRLLPPGISNGNLFISVPTAAGRAYRLESLDAQNPKGWVALATAGSDGSPVQFQHPLSPAAGGTWFRVRVDWPNP